MIACGLAVAGCVVAGRAVALEINFSAPAAGDALTLAAGGNVISIFAETNANPTVRRAVGDLSEDFARVTDRNRR